MPGDPARETALKVLYEVNEKGAYSNIALGKHLDGAKLTDIDRAFATELVYGVLKWRLTLDWIIEQFSKVRLKKISPWILNILRLGIYQLIFTAKVPVSAACNESVKLAASYGHKASSGFVNGMLRNIARRKESLGYPEKGADIDKYLTVGYSYPEWMVRKFMQLFGEEFTESLLDAGNQIPEFSIRVNRLKTSRDSLLSELAGEGVEALPGRYSPDAAILKNPSSIARLESFKKGLFQVQDESSMLVAGVLDPKPGELVLDACSAPGGKAVHIAQLMEDKGQIIARDVHEHKVKLVEAAAARLGISIIKAGVYDSTVPDGENSNKVDRVLLDAPCTGLGIIRRKPDIKWVRESSDSHEITALQRKLINAVSGCVKPGGILVYSTCTIVPEENTEIVRGFLKDNPDFIQDEIAPYLPQTLAQHVMDTGMVQLYPNRDGIDGFFIARLRRKKKEG